jgi:class 3 adenylate cyclase
LAQRVADADRDRAVTLLREHVVVGRLTLDEFSERVGLALRARTKGDLEAVMANLPELASPLEETSRRKARRWFVGIMSGASAKGRWRVSGQTNAIAFMGGCDLDLRHAEIDGPEVVITAVAFMGGVQIIVPEGFDVQLEGFAFMGGRDLKLRNVPMVPGSPRIRVRGFAMMGGIDVRSKPSRSGKEIGQTIVDHVLGVVDSMPSLAGSPGTPIDLESLGRDFKEQFRAQRHADKRQRREREQPLRPPSEPVVPDMPRPGEGTVTILFSDMVNYAGMTERLGDQVSRELLREHHQIVRESLQSHGGREVKVQGDGFMVAFGGVARAMRCAAEMQRAFVTYSQGHEEHPIQIHIGIHTGEAMEEDDDFLGHTVIVASRIAAVAGPGEVLVSSLSAQLVERTEEFHFVNYRQEMLKGLERPQQVATLLWSD